MFCENEGQGLPRRRRAWRVSAPPSAPLPANHPLPQNRVESRTRDYSSLSLSFSLILSHSLSHTHARTWVLYTTHSGVRPDLQREERGGGGAVKPYQCIRSLYIYIYIYNPSRGIFRRGPSSEAHTNLMITAGIRRRHAGTVPCQRRCGERIDRGDTHAGRPSDTPSCASSETRPLWAGCGRGRASDAPPRVA